jgi:capsular polysaccharide export protein
MATPLAEMRRALDGVDMDLPDAPARWGALRQHVFYGALYHFVLLVANRRYGPSDPTAPCPSGRSSGSTSSASR